MNKSNFLEKLRESLYNEIPILGGWIRRQALRKLAKNKSPEATKIIAEAVIKSEDRKFAVASLQTLRQMAENSVPEAQEALCSLVIDHDHPEAHKITSSSCYAPGDERRRALFYFLTKNWEKYENLDFDHSMLQVIFDRADENLRNKIAEKVRIAGRVDWVEIISGSSRRMRMLKMTDKEWDTVLSTISESLHWDKMWQLAQEAPPTGACAYYSC